MDYKVRILKLKQILKFAQSDIPDFPKVYASGQFGNHEILRTDFNLNFDTINLDELFSQSANKEWISIPDQARKKKIPHLFYLNPTKATDHEKYFGIYDQTYGFVDTPVSAAFKAAIKHRQPQLGTSEDLTNIKLLEVPKELEAKLGESGWIATFTQPVERAIINNAMYALSQSGMNPDHIRRFQVTQDGGVMGTTVGGRVFESGGTHPVSEKVDKKLQLLERAQEKTLDSYPLLERTISTFLKTLDNRIDKILSEQRSVNRAIRFEGSKEDMDDIIRQNILRLIINALKDESSPLHGTEFFEKDYTII